MKSAADAIWLIIQVAGAVTLVVTLWFADAAFLRFLAIVFVLGLITIGVVRLADLLKVDRWFRSPAVTLLTYEYPAIPFSAAVTLFTAGWLAWGPELTRPGQYALLLLQVTVAIWTGLLIAGFLHAYRRRRLTPEIVAINTRWLGRLRRGIGERSKWSWLIRARETESVWKSSNANGAFEVQIHPSIGFNRNLAGFWLRRLRSLGSTRAEAHFWTTNRRWRSIWPLAVYVDGENINPGGADWLIPIHGHLRGSPVTFMVTASDGPEGQERFAEGYAFRVTALFDDGSYAQGDVEIRGTDFIDNGTDEVS